MKIGDLVTKTGGYGKNLNWVGIIINVISNELGIVKFVVLHDGDLDHWHMKMTEIIR